MTRTADMTSLEIPDAAVEAAQRECTFVLPKEEIARMISAALPHLTAGRATAAPSDAAQIKHMVERFLRWKLPEHFRPDAGVEFHPSEQQKAGVHQWPVGTNLFDANQATEMVRFIVEGLPGSALVSAPAAEAEPVALISDELRGWIAYALTKRLVIDMPTARAAVDDALRSLNLAAPSPSQEATAEPVAWPNWFGWRSVDTAPEDQHVILATSGGHVGEALMLIDEDTGRQKWTWALGPVHHHHTPFGWMPLPDALQSPVASDLRPGGFDGPTGAE